MKSDYLHITCFDFERKIGINLTIHETNETFLTYITILWMKYFQWYITSYQSLVQHQYICPGIYPATNNFSILNPFTYICWHRDGKGRSISVLWSGHCPGLGRGVQGLYGQGHEVALIYLCPLQQGLLYRDHHLHLRLQKKKFLLFFILLKI